MCLCLLVLFTQFQTASALLCPPPPKTPVTCSPSDGSCFRPDISISPITSNKCIGLFTKFTSSENSTTKDLYLRFFNADTNQTTNNVSFFINVTKQDKILEHDLFFTHSGILTIKFQTDMAGNRTSLREQDPVLGGWTSANDTFVIRPSIFTNVGLYHVHVEILAINYTIVNQTNTPKFDSWWAVDDKGNISIYDNSTTSFGSIIPSVKIKDESPLKQFKSGISTMDVKCSVGYVLTIKAEDGSPACVRPLTVKILAEEGWAKFESTQSNHAINAKTNPFGIVGLMYYYGGGPCGVGTCPLNTFNLKMNSNYTTYLLGYNICNDNSCIVQNDLSTLLPLNVIGMPNYKFIALPENPQWKYGDVFHIQVEVSSVPDNKTAIWTDLGNSTIIH